MVCDSAFQRGQYGKVCLFASTSCKYDLFVLSCTRVRRVWPGIFSSVVFMCGGV